MLAGDRWCREQDDPPIQPAVVIVDAALLTVATDPAIGVGMPKIGDSGTSQRRLMVRK